MGKIKKSPVIILAIIAAVLYVIIYILPAVTGVLRSSYTAEYGELKTFDKAEGYVVRNEFVYFRSSRKAVLKRIRRIPAVMRNPSILRLKEAAHMKM